MASPPNLSCVLVKKLFESKRSSEPEQLWYIEKRNERLKASCCSCKSTMPPGKIFVYVKGLYIPRGKRFAIIRQFYFCADLNCLTKKPLASNLHVPPNVITVRADSQLSPADIALVRSRELPIKF